MTITEATHALAALPDQQAPARRDVLEAPMRMNDAMAHVEPTWVEAIALVQGVCAQLAPGREAPSLDAILILPSGEISFPPGETADDRSAVAGVGRLLSAVLKSADCPMPLWEAMELARRSPQTAGTARAFGQSLTCFPAAQGPAELAKYYQAAQQMAPPATRASATPVWLNRLTFRAGVALLLVSLCGIGTGVTMGLLLAGRSPRPAPTAPAGDGATTVARLPPFVS